MPFLRHLAFLTTVANLRQLPDDSLAEVAFAGRSNAGKSSAINTLANHTRLAHTSKTPGRTQHLNFFTVQPGRFLVDLPGYGFAKAPEEIRGQWDSLIGPYLAKRDALKGLVIIMDSRRPMTELDCRLIDWFAPTGRPIHILLSKADKLTRQEQAKAIAETRGFLKNWTVPVSVQLFSSLKKTGVEEADQLIGGWLGLGDLEAAKKEPPGKGMPGG
ncbi:MAG TPA: ribosome biogenesis GTP-binding protein YihA/YsxC [Rhodocyclaceae bacterium]